MVVLLHRGAAARHVDRDEVEALVGRDRRARELLGGLLDARVHHQRAAAARLPGGVDLPALGGEHAHGGGVDVAEERALDAALHEADAALARALRGHDLGQPPHRRAQLDRRRQPQHRAQVRLLDPLAEPLVDAEPALQRHQRRERAHPAGVGEQLEDHPPVRALGAGARAVALDLRAHLLDQPVVLDARRARGHAGHAAEAVVEVLGHLRGDLGALLVADAHQHDPPARRVVLVLEHLVARARRQAEAAVHAVLDQVQLGRLVLVPGDGHG